MVGEYSRELANSVLAAQCRLIELGFHKGGAAGFGLCRVLIDARGGNVKAELKRGEHKSLQTDQVIAEGLDCFDPPAKPRKAHRSR